MMDEFRTDMTLDEVLENIYYQGYGDGIDGRKLSEIKVKELIGQHKLCMGVQNDF